MAKEEKLNPVITIVFYHGEETYDGCMNLHDMLELKEENKTCQRIVYKRFIADYHVNLVKAGDLDEGFFVSRVCAVKFLCCSSSVFLAKIRLKKISIPITIVWMEGYICVKWNLRWSAPAF